jgi:hypothetical protein
MASFVAAFLNELNIFIYNTTIMGICDKKK